MGTLWHLLVTVASWYAVYFAVVAAAAGLWIHTGIAREERRTKARQVQVAAEMDAEIEALLTSPFAAEVARTFR